MPEKLNEVIILHTVDDAKNCLKRGIYRGKALFSTHPSVTTYFREYYKMECVCLSVFFTIAERKKIRDVSYRRVEELLALLDDKIRPVVKEQARLDIDFFVPLYQYVGKYHLSGYNFFKEAIKKIIGIYKFDRLYFYEYVENINLRIDFEENYFSDIRIDVEILKHSRKKWEKFNLSNVILRAKRFAKKGFVKVWNERLERKKFNEKVCVFSRKRKTILLYDLLYDLDFLKGALTDYNVLYYDSLSGESLKPDIEDVEGMRFGDVGRINFKNEIENGKNVCERMFLKGITGDFKKNIDDYLKKIRIFDVVNKDYPVSVGIWGNPPILGIKALLFEHMRRQKIMIIGAQHGFSYVDSINPLHFDSDFCRCDVFMSYGFTKEDLNKTYPESKSTVEILPVGKALAARMPGKKKVVDVLFPLASCFSVLSNGMITTTPHELTKRQIRILEYLDSLGNKNIYVKLFVGETDEKCPVVPVLRRMKNLKIINYLTLTEFLEEHTPRAVILELPSTPLYDVLHLDTEIFLMNDDLRPFEKSALSEVKRRVHYDEDVKGLLEKVDLFVKGKLEKKRDDVFCNHYVYKDGRQAKILEAINSFM